MNLSKYIALFAMLSTSALAGNNNLTCPSSVKAGTALTISMTVTNQDCNKPLNIQNTVVGLLGNSGGSVGLQGPFVASYTGSVSAASCQQIPYDPNFPEYGSYAQVTPGSRIINPLQIVSKVPANMAGTLIAVTAGIKDTANNLKMQGICQINVTK